MVTKSKSLIRRTLKEDKKPTHLQMMEYVRDNYYVETYEFVKRMIDFVTQEHIYDILHQYTEEELSKTKKIIIERYLLYKVHDLERLYFGKDEENVC